MELLNEIELNNNCDSVRVKVLLRYKKNKDLIRKEDGIKGNKRAYSVI